TAVWRPLSDFPGLQDQGLRPNPFRLDKRSGRLCRPTAVSRHCRLSDTEQLKQSSERRHQEILRHLTTKAMCILFACLPPFLKVFSFLSGVPPALDHCASVAGANELRQRGIGNCAAVTCLVAVLLPATF